MTFKFIVNLDFFILLICIGNQKIANFALKIYDIIEIGF